MRASSISRRIRDRFGQADEDRLADQEMADIEFADMGDRRDGLRHCRRSGHGRHGFPAPDRRRIPPPLRICFEQLFARRAARHWHRRRCAVPPPARPASRAASSCLRSGSMNIETRMPASASAATMGFRRANWPTTSMPPSVVRSSRFSGTMQAACGRALSAMASISSVAAISRLSGMFSSRDSRAMSSSEICRRSSRRWAVMPSAPASCASMRGAHRIGIVAAARVAHGGDVIDIDAEAKRLHGRLLSGQSSGYPASPRACCADAAAACRPARPALSIPPARSAARRPWPCRRSGRSGSRPPPPWRRSP